MYWRCKCYVANYIRQTALLNCVAVFSSRHNLVKYAEDSNLFPIELY